MAAHVVQVRRSLADFPTPTPQPTPCRLWQGALTSAGYGRRRDGQRMHRWVWEQANGPIPPGLVVRHKCDQPLCYRLDHLALGTHGDNVRDTQERGHHVPPPVMQGERNPAAKLTAEQAEAIRASDASDLDTANEYGVSRSLVRAIRQGKLWRSQQKGTT